MTPEMRSKILSELKKDARIQRGTEKFPRTVLIHLTEEQWQYLESQKRSYRHGKAWFLRRLLIIDMVKKSFQQKD